MKNFDVIAYLSPVFSPAVGGGVVYLQLLSERILEGGVCKKFVIVTESYPGTLDVEERQNGRLKILRKYPFRAGRNVKNVFSYILYFVQNLQFFSLPFFLKKASVSVLMVHGSFVNNPTTLWFVLRLLRTISSKIILVADLRDPKLPHKKVKMLNLFDLVISCSENVTGRLKDDRDVYSKVHEIPIPVDVVRPNDFVVRDIQTLYGLENQKYVFNGSGLSSEKGVERLVELVSAIRRNGYDVSLVVVGKKRFWTRRLGVAEQEGWFHYLGVVTHAESMALSVGAWLDANLSSVDSMPRHSLEALMSGSRVLLPNGVPEFERVCPDFIAHEESISDLAVKAIHIAENDFGRCEYDVSRHHPDVVLKEYVSALRSIA